ncbi:MAG: sulfurtransferase [Nevskiaceae bacterium]|nr:MAG: sulfurtransferase [Nevskiaceae bacterium]TBR73190.1 MAG: sulfurtransferase [Nevskiaceae bacterium]
MGMAVLGMGPVNAALPGPLVSAQWLHEHLAGVTVVDVLADPAQFTSAPKFGIRNKAGVTPLVAAGGHIPGARLVTFSAIRTTQKVDGRKIPAMLPTADQFQAVMRAAGVDDGHPLVITSRGSDAGDLDMATRLLWTLKTYGAVNVAVLNGGTAGWLQAGYEVETRAATKKVGNWTAKPADRRWLATSADVVKAQTAGSQLVDARPTAQFLGISKNPVVSEFGHIAGARSFPTDAIVRTEGAASYFMTPAQYTKLLPELGIDPKKPAITYCNTGHLASGAWFVLNEVMAVGSTRLYDGSMLEWAMEGRPTAPAKLYP